jgi:hypothetical protein
MTPIGAERDAQPKLLPKDERPPFRPADWTPSFEWSGLIDAYVHPAKIFIVEALQWTGQPLSAKELNRMSSAVDFNLVDLSYHLRTLARVDLLEVTDESPTRGSMEKFYFFDHNRFDACRCSEVGDG